MTEPSTSTPLAPPPRSNTGLIVAGILAAIVLGVLGFTHFVQSSGGLLVIPKSNFSFSMTFTSVDEVLDRNNHSRSNDPILEHLVQELGTRHVIKSSFEDSDSERELARIWKQTEDQGVELAPYAKEIVQKYYPDSR